MAARTTTGVRLVRGDQDRQRASAPTAAGPEAPVAASHGLSVVHFDDEQDGHLEVDERPEGNPIRKYARLSELIKERVRARTAERIRNLDVVCTSECVVIRGQCATFYTKQLAQHAAMGVIEDETVVNEINVGFRR